MNEPPIVPGSDRPQQSTDQSTTARTSAPARGKKRSLLDSRPAMFALLFGVTGFLGIPFLLRSRVFSQTEKIVWSIVVTIYTCILLGITYAILSWSYRVISESFGF